MLEFIIEDKLFLKIPHFQNNKKGREDKAQRNF